MPTPTDTEGHGPRHNCAECAERYASERQEAMRAAFAFDREPAAPAAPAMTTGVACNCGAHRDSDCDCAYCAGASDSLATHFACAVCGAASGEVCRAGCSCAQCHPESHG